MSLQREMGDFPPQSGRVYIPESFAFNIRKRESGHFAGRLLKSGNASRQNGETHFL